MAGDSENVRNLIEHSKRGRGRRKMKIVNTKSKINMRMNKTKEINDF